MRSKILHIRIIILLCLSILAFRPYIIIAQSPERYIEITEIDITELDDFRSDKISVLGVKLGMNKVDAISTLSDNGQYFIEADKFDSNRFYLYDKDNKGFKKNCILYFVWDNEGTSLKRITLYTKFMNYLVGNTQHLLTYDVLNRRSKITKNFLKSPHKSEVTMDIPVIKLKETTYYYLDKWLEVSCRVEEDFYKFIRVSFVNMY